MSGIGFRNATFHATAISRFLYVLNIVLVLPPAPAALVLDGLALATLSALSAAAFRLMAVLGPPGGDDGRAVLEPAD